MEQMSLAEAVIAIKQKIPTLSKEEILNGFDLNISLTDVPFFVNVTPSEINFFINTPNALDVLQRTLL